MLKNDYKNIYEAMNDKINVYQYIKGHKGSIINYF